MHELHTFKYGAVFWTTSYYSAVCLLTGSPSDRCSRWLG